MRPISELDAEEASGLIGVVFDLDDTVLTRGLLHPDAYSACWALREAGYELYAASGRPALWLAGCVVVWGLTGAVAENGAVLVDKDGRCQLLGPDSRRDRCQDEVRECLKGIVGQLSAEFPEAVLSNDTPFRLGDVAYDIGEYRTLPLDVVTRLQRRAEELGAQTVLSSIHLHVSFARENKASAFLRMLEKRGIDATVGRSKYAFIGDGANDASCFDAFRISVGVANVRRALPAFTLGPRYVTRSPFGAGFAEFANKLLERRR